MRPTILVITLITTLMLASCRSNTAAEPPQITVEDAWVRLPPGIHPQEGDKSYNNHMSGNNTAAYMSLRNNGSVADFLIDVQSEMAESSEIHKTQTEGGVSIMKKIEQIEIPAGSEAVLQPGGLHIMLINLKGKLNEGDTVKITLEFEQSGLVEVNAEVRIP